MHRSRSREKSNAEGYVQPRKYIKASRIELDSYFSCDPTTEPNSITFVFKSSSFEKKTKSPARDPLAEEMSVEKQIKRSSPTVIARLMGLDTLPSPVSLKPHECSLGKINNDVPQEFKDVFEVAEVPKVENRENQDIRKRRPNVKQSEMGKAFIRQSFINAKSLSKNEMLHRSKEFDNALEVLESNKGLFLKLLQEPNFLFSKQIQDLSHCPPSPHARCESSLRSEIKDKRSINLQISDSRPPPKKPTAYSNGHPLREPMCSLPTVLSDSMYVEKAEDYAQHPQIVILKPSLRKALNCKEFPNETMENNRLRKKHASELPKDATFGRKVSVSKYSNYGLDDDGRLCSTPSIANGMNSLTSYRTFDNVYEYGKNLARSSSSSIESSVTLGEMLALSDKDTSAVKKACSLSISSKDGWKDGFSRNLTRSKSLPSSSLVYENCHHNYRNRIVGGKSRFMPKNVRNMSAARTFVDENLVKPKNSSLKCLPDSQSKLHSDGRGNRLPGREIRVSSSEFKRESYVFPLAKQEHTAYNLSDIHTAGTVDIFSVPSDNIIGVPSLLKVSPDSYKEADQPSPVSVLELSSKDDNPNSRCFKKKISSNLEDLQMQLQCPKFSLTDSFVEEIEAFTSCDEDSGEPFPQLGGDLIQAFRDEEEREYSYLLDMLIDSEILRSEKIALFNACQFAELPVGVHVFDKLEKKYKSVEESWSRSERKLLFDLINSTLADISTILFMNFYPWVKPNLCWKSKIVHEGFVEEIWQALMKSRKEINCKYSKEKPIELKWSDTYNDSEVIGREVENMLSEYLMDQLVTELIYM